MPVVITGRAHHVNPVRLRTSIANDIATVEFSVYEYEQIRKAAENTDIIVAGTTIKFTLSAGVYSAIAEDINNPSLFTDYADKALYHAKQTGRNRVVSYPLPD